MKRIFGAVLALIVAAGALAPATASAQHYRHYGHYSYGRHYGHGDAVAAGVVGLALGAIIGSAVTSDHHRYYNRGYYDRGYYNRGYYDDGYYDNGYDDGYGGPALCIVRTQRWDPYYGRPVIVEERRPC